MRSLGKGQSVLMHLILGVEELSTDQFLCPRVGIAFGFEVFSKEPFKHIWHISQVTGN